MGRQVLGTVLGVLLVDQVSKFLVRKFMYLGQSIPLLDDWLRLTYTENPGIAFGIRVGPDGLVPLIAIAATLLIVGYLWYTRHQGALYRFLLAMVLGGALGNIIDRVFYARLYGYGGFFEGRVVDFIHIDLWHGTLPEWIPLFGGQFVALFPVWNVADMAIVLGMLGVLVLQHRQMRHVAAEAPPALQETTLDA